MTVNFFLKVDITPSEKSAKLPNADKRALQTSDVVFWRCGRGERSLANFAEAEGGYPP